MNLFRPIRNGVGIIAAFIVIAAGCGGGNGDGLGEESISRGVTTSGRYKMLSFSGTARSLYHRGDMMQVTLTVTNNATRAVEYGFGACEVQQSLVRKGDGTVLTSFGRWEGCTDEDKGGTLAPGESRTFPMTWYFGELEPWQEALPISHTFERRPLPAGRYTVQPVFDIRDLDGESLGGPDKPRPVLGPGPIPFTLREQENGPAAVN